MANVTTLHIASLLDKMTSSDKDFRFMATNDLMTELQKDSIKLDDESERKVVKMLLKLLEDKNGEVQNLAVKCLGPLVNKVKDPQVETIVETLCSNMLSDREQLRDISSIGLKTVIAELAPGCSVLATNICKKITSRLTSAVSKQDDISIQLETLDILSDLLNRFGGLLTSFHPVIQQVLIPQLSSSRLAIRKRAIIAISNLSTTSSNQLFDELITFLLHELERNASISTTRTYIQCLGSITRQSGHRVGEHLEQALPLVTHYCSLEKKRQSMSSDGDDDELRECCIQTLEFFVRRCPKNVGPYLETIIKICLESLVHDPNYSYGNDEDADMDVQKEKGYGDENEDDEDENEDDDDGDDQNRSDVEYSDDDDVSWKVRRAAAKCLGSIFSIRHDLLNEFYEVVSPVLISRFKEREENVKSDIFASYISLLHQTRSTAAIAMTTVSIDDGMEIIEGPVAQLAGQVPKIVRAMHKLLKEKSAKTKQGCFLLLSELVQTLPGCLKDHMHLVVPGLQHSLIDKSSSSTMKIEALSFLHLLLMAHSPLVFRPHLNSLVNPVIQCIADPFYKVASEALQVAQQLVKVLRPLESTSDPLPTPAQQQHLFDIFTASVKRLTATDVDQEVKERAISCTAQIVCHGADILGPKRLDTCLPIFYDRLRNETTRLSAAKALAAIASSPLHVQLPSSLLADCVPLLGTFLRKNQRGLRLCSLQCLDALARGGYVSATTADAFDATTGDAAALVSDVDLHVAQLALQLLTSLCRMGRASAVIGGASPVIGQVIGLVKSPLLQGTALQSVMDFLVALLHSHEQNPKLMAASFNQLFTQLTQPIHDSIEQTQQQSLGNTVPSVILHKQAYHSIAKCVAILLAEQSARHGSTSIDGVIEGFMRAISQPATPHPVQLLAILGIGEAGRKCQLGPEKCSRLQKALLDCFSSNNDDIKQSSAIAMGAIAVGNLDIMLPFILQEIESQPAKRQYLLLHSLKEVISSSQQQLPANAGESRSSNEQTAVGDARQLAPYVKKIWNLLMKNCECSEEGTRNVVAECLGRLALLDPEDLIPRLRDCLSLSSPLARSTAIAAIKFVVSDQPQSHDGLLKQSIGEFLDALRDEDVNVRRVALVAFNSVAHNKPTLMRDLLPQVLPHLYGETKVRKELIREVEMGPFKHTVDDGLDIRKAAFECMYTLLDSCLEKVDIFEFLVHLEEGLNDHYDIKMLTYLMLVRLSHLCPGAVLQHLDKIIEPLKITCTSKVRATSVKQEFEKQDELKRSAMRAVAALALIPDADKCPLFMEFMGQVKMNSELSSILDSIKESSSSSSSSAAAAALVGGASSSSPGGAGGSDLMDIS